MSLTRAQSRADLVLGAVVFVGTLISTMLLSVAGVYNGDHASLPLTVAYALILALALAVRRRWPAMVSIVVSATYLVAATLRVPDLYAGNIAMFIAMYTVGAWSADRRRATAARIVIIVGMFVWISVTVLIDATQPPPEGAEETFSRAGAFSPYLAYMILTILINVLYFGGAYYFGERTYQQMRERAALEERTLELERERELTAAQAVALDRVRIARELHDVVAHHVSLMGVQAGAARSVMTRDPEHARELVKGVESSARESLSELRHLLTTLRTPDGDSHPQTAPTTRGLAAVAALVDEATAAGMPTTFVEVGAPLGVPDLVQVNLYRIAQEALTNARRHAGAHATADVRLRFAAHSVELEITNTGRVGPSGPGLGQLGMRERAVASGGTIEIGPRPRGGYLVRVRVPLQEEAVDA